MHPLTVGVLLAAASASPAAERGGLSLRVLQPVYRDSLYATQAEQPIVVRAELPEALRTRTAELRGRLLDGQRRAVAVTQPGLKPGDVVRFDGTSLPVGTYEIEIRAVGAGSDGAGGMHEVDSQAAAVAGQRSPHRRAPQHRHRRETVRANRLVRRRAAG